LLGVKLLGKNRAKTRAKPACGRTHRQLIRNVRPTTDKDTQRVFQRLASKSLSIELQRIAYRKLTLINAVETINDLRIPPGNRLEKLKGDREGQYSIRINNQWRICFDWKDNDAYRVEIVDYHH
jgi:proteic killer suppression protein